MAHTRGLLEPKRQRGGTKKSRAGCRTCRLRHIKCDETPVVCKNCARTGRACDYDLQRLPRSKLAIRKDKRQLQDLTLTIKDSFRWAITTDERRCYSYFQHRTVLVLSDSFDSRLWQAHLLNMSKSEPAVYHAVIAFSAVHQDLETYGMPLPGQDLRNEWHLFALEQCGRSFALLSRRQSSQDPRFREVMLLCCLLFVMTQLLRGQYDDAFLHLRSGLRILNEAKALSSSETPIEPCIVAAFANLESQSLQYGVRGELTNSESAYPGIFNDFGAFSSLNETRQAFDYLTSTAFRFILLCKDLSEREILSDYAFLNYKQLQILSQLSIFGHRFEPFHSSSNLALEERRGADVLRLLYCSLALQVKTALIRNEAVLEYYNPEYETHLTMVAQLLNKYPARPSVILEAGILSPLYYAAMWCRDYSVRRRAIGLLLSWPHREGAFDSNWAAFQGLQRMNVELSIRPEPYATTYNTNQKSSLNGDRWLGIKCSELSFEAALSFARCMHNRPCFRVVRKWLPAVLFDSQYSSMNEAN
ncbi:Zn(II)2Cys6 transcription factor [Aspergillus foveolatus]|uniref:Zn(II)2Cys6 transcription factor n=1 Tax=Aspergillus foveolatus TaxID=210207 RepID=UPI003CCCEBE1